MKFLARLISLGILVLAALLPFAGCATEKASGLNSTSAQLRGMAYNESRMPVQDAKVSWLVEGKVAGTARTDIHGRYLIPGVAYGPVTLEFAKEGYELLAWSFTFERPTQVVYVQMSNLNELLDDAANNIEKRSWSAAAAYLLRAQKMDPGNVVATYLEAQMESRQGFPEKAAALLEKLSSERDASFAVELTLADLYQDELSQPDKALLHLKKALTIQDDVDVEARIAALEKK
jgi:tetratricopeptide (TPR) repeat protein